jgi:hypothetical protein
MTRRGAIGQLCVAAVVGAAGLVVAAAPAGAAKVTGSGTVACSYGTTMTFSPPLQPGRGTPVAAGGVELVTMAPATIGSCSGSVTSGSVPTSGTNSKPITLKVKANVFNKVHYVGGCLFYNGFQLQIKRTTINWTVSSGALKSSKLAPGIAALGTNAGGNLGFALSGHGTGSFAGPAALDLYFDTPSSSALQGCLGGSGTVSTLTIDPTQSSIALG